LLFSTQTNLLCSIININEPLHSQDFYRNQFPLSSSTQHHQCIIINTHTSHQQSIGNAQNTGNAYQQQRRKITSGGETEHGLLCFFHRNQTNFVWFLWKKHSKPDFWEKWVWFAVCGFAVFGLWEKCKSCGFLWMGCLAKRLGRKRTRRAPSASEKNGDSLLWQW